MTDPQPTEPHWTEPGAYQVADGVHRIPLPLPMDGLRAVNVYALETGSGLTLIDGGWAVEDARRRLEAGLKEIGYELGDITRFLVTHVHRDHYTQAVTIRRELGAHVSLGLGEKPTLDVLLNHPDEDPVVARLRRAGAPALGASWARHLQGRPDPEHWAYPDAWLEGDHPLQVGKRTLDAVATPGHTRGHFVFADRADGLLFAGDHVLPSITPSIGFEASFAAQPLGDFLSSLAKVRALPDLRLLPAHGPVTTSTHARIDELLAHHEERLALCRQAVETGATTAYDVAKQLPWTRRGKSLADLDLFNAALATMETFAHVELLAAQGRVRRTEDDDVVGYAPLTG